MATKVTFNLLVLLNDRKSLYNLSEISKVWSELFR